MKIHTLATQGDLDEIRNELRNGVPVDARDEKDYTPLAYAASSPNADEEMLRLLLSSGADINAAVDNGMKVPIGLAACSGSIKKSQLLLDAGADVNVVSPKGYSVLINVIYSLHDDDMLMPVVSFLVRNRAKIDCETEYGESPLSVAYRLERFDVVRCLLDAGADPSPLRWTNLFRAIAFESVEDVERCLAEESDVSYKDRFGRTPLLLAAIIGDVEKAKLLHAAGANLEERARGGDTALMHCVASDNIEMLQWLVEHGADIEAVDDSGSSALMLAAQAGASDCVRLLLERGANPSRKNEYNDNAISMASSEQVIRLLAGAGEDIGEISTEMKRALTGLHDGDSLKISKDEYLLGNRPRFGTSNPELMEIPFWREMVRAGIGAYAAKAQFGDGDKMEGPVWCFSRYGTSFTELPDGRFVQIGGEHEDFYDPDFCIYNDVIVHDRSGTFTIFGYPKQEFPPTDFHSATFVEDFIYIIGGVGYQGSRKFGFTPIYRLNCETWAIEALESAGEMPGWIYQHKTTYSAPGVLIVFSGKICQDVDGEEQHIENGAVFHLNLSNMTWTRT